MNGHESEGHITPEDIEWLERMSPKAEPSILKEAEDIVEEESFKKSLEALIEAYHMVVEKGDGEQYVEDWREALRLFDEGQLHPNSSDLPGSKYINSKTFNTVRKFLELRDRGEL